MEWHAEQLREPHFHQLRFDLLPEQCTLRKLFVFGEASFPEEVTITNPRKLLWKNNQVTKLDFLRYLRKASPNILPFLKNRALTVIRSPHGVFGEAFYQKNRPDSAPDFIQSHTIDDTDFIVCNDLRHLFGLEISCQ